MQALGVLAQLSLLLTACFCTTSAFNLAKEQKTSWTVWAHRQQLRFGNSSDTGANLTLYFFPGPALYGIVEDQTVNLTFDYSLDSPVDLSASFSVADLSVAELLPQDNWTLTLRRNHAPDVCLTTNSPENCTRPLSHRLMLRGLFLGRTELRIAINTTTDIAKSTDELKFRLSVVRYLRVVDKVFRIVVWTFVLFANIGIGCEIELKVVKRVMRRPVAPVIGLVSQYLFMPMISYCVLLLIDIPASTALGYFGIGCAPGGGASNFYCLLLGGNVSLSITMTLLSTIAALGMVPMYMFTLGQQVLKSRDININIPYWNILLTLLMILIPTAIGFFIERHLPRLGRLLRRILKPLLICFILFMFTVGFYANLYILKLFTPSMVLAGCCLPYLGFIFGALLASAFCLDYCDVVTIGLETMIQNAGLPILILQTSLPQPDADLSLVGPVAAMTFTPLPLFVWLLARCLRRRCCPAPHSAEAAGDGDGDADGRDLAMEEHKVTTASESGETGDAEEAEKFLPPPPPPGRADKPN